MFLVITVHYYMYNCICLCCIAVIFAFFANKLTPDCRIKLKIFLTLAIKGEEFLCILFSNIKQTTFLIKAQINTSVQARILG